MKKSIFSAFFIILSISIAAQSANYTPKLHISQQERYTIQSTPFPPLGVKAFTAINLSSQTTLGEFNSHKRIAPASLTKLMALLIAYDYLAKGLIQTTDLVYVSTKAWKMEGSRMFLEPGTQEPLSKIIEGISVASGNDASIALAEHIAGSESAFVELMNKKANLLNLKNTNFVNATGLPHESHYSSAHDMAQITAHLLEKHPTILHYTSQKKMTYRNIKQENRNRLLWSDNSVIGMKTGHTKEAGYCLITVAIRGNQTIVTAIFGANSEKERDITTRKLLNHAQYGFKNITIGEAYPLPEIRTWYAKSPYSKAQVAQPIYLSIPIDQQHIVRTKINIPQLLKAPLKKGQSIGSLQILLDDTPITTTTLVAQDDIAQQSWWQQPLEWLTLQWIQFNSPPNA